MHLDKRPIETCIGPASVSVSKMKVSMDQFLFKEPEKGTRKKTNETNENQRKYR